MRYSPFRYWPPGNETKLTRLYNVSIGDDGEPIFVSMLSTSNGTVGGSFLSNFSSLDGVARGSDRPVPWGDRLSCCSKFSIFIPKWDGYLRYTQNIR